MPSVPNQYENWAPVIGSETAYVQAHRNGTPAPPPVKKNDGGYGGSTSVKRSAPINIPVKPRKSRHSSEHSRSHSRRTLAAATRALSRFFGFDRHREERERAAHRTARHLARRQARAERDFQARAAEGRRTGLSEVIRREYREAFARRERLPDARIYLLAAIEGAHIDRPGHRRRLANGLVVRLCKYEGAYYFLSNTGYYYKSTHRYGGGDDLDFVVDTWVPITVRMFAEPYRQMCRR
ncbi:hypothetical protein F4805DRAFT_453309 [Annulohypoxylon moriforme]|nr:hypothetical protein F4805DRAFT_453309 [Annulohypoxylon moriforme]